MDLLALIFGWSYVFVYVCVYSPFLIYHLFRFGSKQTHVIYRLRYSKITIFQAVIFIFKLFLGATTGVACTYQLYQENSLTDNILDAADAYISTFFLYCFVWKFWLLRFNIMLHSALMNCEWKSVINSKGYTQHKSFYVKHRRTLGRSKWTMLIFAAIALLCTTPNILIMFLPDIDHKNHWLGLTELDYLLPLLLLIVIWCSTPAFDDNFYIRKEIKFVFLCLVAMYMSFYTGHLLERFNFMELEDDTLEIVEFVCNQITTGSQFVAMMICTFWVNRRCERIIESKRFQIHKIHRKSVFDKQHTFEIAPKQKKVNDHIEEISRSRTFPPSVKVQMTGMTPQTPYPQTPFETPVPQSAENLVSPLTSPQGADTLISPVTSLTTDELKRPSASVTNLRRPTPSGYRRESDSATTVTIRNSVTITKTETVSVATGKFPDIKFPEVHFPGLTTTTTVPPPHKAVPSESIHSVQHSTSMPHGETPEPEAPESLQSILADDRLLDLLAKHLVKEFCIECLLSLIEMQQFKKRLLKELNVKQYGPMVDLAPGAPLSELVFADTNPTLESFKKIAYELHQKYVEEGSEFEINISSRMRRQLHATMGDYDKWMKQDLAADELSWIFDDVMAENIKLLRQSKGRFHGNLERMSR